MIYCKNLWGMDHLAVIHHQDIPHRVVRAAPGGWWFGPGMVVHLMGWKCFFFRIPSRELTCPHLGKRKLIGSKVIFGWDSVNSQEGNSKQPISRNIPYIINVPGCGYVSFWFGSFSFGNCWKLNIPGFVWLKLDIPGRLVTKNCWFGSMFLLFQGGISRFDVDFPGCSQTRNLKWQLQLNRIMKWR